MYLYVCRILSLLSFLLPLFERSSFSSMLDKAFLFDATESIIAMSYLLIKNNGQRNGQRTSNGRRNPSIPLNRVGGSGPSWRNNGASSSSSSTFSSAQQRPPGGGANSSFARSSNGMRSFTGGGGGVSNRGGMNGNAAQGRGGEGTVVNVNGGGGQIQLQRPVVVAQQQQQHTQQQHNRQHDGNLQQGIVSMDDGEFTLIY